MVNITISVNDDEVIGDCYKCKYGYGASFSEFFKKYLFKCSNPDNTQNGYIKSSEKCPHYRSKEFS